MLFSNQTAREYFSVEPFSHHATCLGFGEIQDFRERAAKIAEYKQRRNQYRKSTKDSKTEFSTKSEAEAGLIKLKNIAGMYGIQLEICHCTQL